MENEQKNSGNLVNKNEIVSDKIKETNGFDIEKLKMKLNVLVMKILSEWNGEKSAKKANISGETVNLSKLDLSPYQKDDSELFGSYTINLESIGVNYLKKEIIIKILDVKDLGHFNGRSRSELVKYVVKTYGEKYYIPGLEYENYLVENPDMIPEEIKDGNRYNFIGSFVRGVDGECGIPFVKFGAKFHHGLTELNGNYGNENRVVLIEK